MKEAFKILLAIIPFYLFIGLILWTLTAIVCALFGKELPSAWIILTWGKDILLKKIKR